jgi:hypothetical protein
MKNVHMLFVVIVMLFLAGTGNAGIWYVHPDSTLNSIQIALNSCSENDTVLVGPGTYYENIIWPHIQGIDLVSEYGPDTTIIDGDSVGSVIKIDTIADTTTVIRGFTIQHGYASQSGGAIMLNFWLSSPTITENSIINNAANWDGGGISCVYCEPVIVRNTISDNTAGHDGGGIDCWKASATIIDNDISGNTAVHYGGGIDFFRSLPVVTGNKISDNHATRGGGIFHSGSGSSVITGNMIVGNTATAYGGGIYCYESSTANIMVNTISGNSAQEGGGIGCYWSYPVITSNTISANIATQGGGIDCYNSDPIITGNTITANCSAGICCKTGSVPLINYNNIICNRGFGLRNMDAGIVISAEYNWWGHATGPFHPNANPGGGGDTVSDYVDFNPWLAAPVGVEEEPATESVQQHERITATIFSGPLRLPEGKRCKVYDIAGRIVQPSSITRGVYFIEIDGEIVQKVIKIR